MVAAVWSSSPVLTLAGLGHFNGRVLFCRPEASREVTRLAEFAQDLKHFLASLPGARKTGERELGGREEGRGKEERDG